MKEYDRRASEEFGIPSLVLMENAGRGLAEMVIRDKTLKSILVVCGKGNNGGDGFVAARYLLLSGRKVRVGLAADPAVLKGDALINYERLAKQIPVDSLIPVRREAFRVLVREQDAVIDALFGIGLNAAVRKPYAELIEIINEESRWTLAADIPSGLDGDSGEMLGTAVRAHQTGTFGLMKAGLLKGEGKSHAGTIEIIDIGLPELLFE